MHYKLLAPIISVYLCIIASNVYAQTNLSNALDGLRSASFGKDSLIVIGDSVDVIDPITPKTRCIEFEDTAENVRFDTEGAVSSEIDFKIIKNLRQFENTFKLDYRVEASSSANFAEVLSGKASVTNFGKLENYLKEERTSILLLIEAKADHGREIIRNFDLKNEYKDLLKSGNVDEFRKNCGTHFIRGWNRVSTVSVYVEITGLDQQAKFIIENTLDTSVEGKAKLVKFGAEAKLKTTTKISNALKLAEKFGKVKATASARGGKGIETIEALVNTQPLSDPDVLSNLLEHISDAASDFTIKNSAPDQFIIVAYPQLDVQSVTFDQVSYEKLGEIYKALLIADQEVERHNRLKESRYDVWNKYFRVNYEEVNNIRDALIEMYTNCKRFGKCEGVIPSNINNIRIEDLFDKGSLVGGCSYKKWSGNKNLLSSILVTWNSSFYASDDIDFDSLNAFVIDSELQVTRMNIIPNRDQRLKKHANGDGRIYLQLVSFKTDHGISDPVNDEDIKSVRDGRASLANSIFVVSYQTYSGTTIEHTLGTARLEQCPALK